MCQNTEGSAKFIYGWINIMMARMGRKGHLKGIGESKTLDLEGEREEESRMVSTF